MQADSIHSMQSYPHLELISLVIIPFLLAFGLFVAIFALLVKRTSWPRLVKMSVFSFWVALFSFPQFVPFIVPIPLPNIIPVVFGLFADGLDDLLRLYAKTGTYTVVSFIATFVLTFAVAQIIFVGDNGADAALGEKKAQRLWCIHRWIGCALNVFGVLLFLLFALSLLFDLVVGVGMSGLIFKLHFVLLGGMSLWAAQLIKRVDKQGQ